MSAIDRVYAGLKHEILTTARRPDSFIIEHEVAEEFGVSKTPVRDALRLLAHEGWVTIIPRRGYLVRSLRLEDVSEIYGLRQMIEPNLAALAAERGTASDQAELLDILQTQETSGDADAAFSAGTRFHMKIAGMSRNSRATATLGGLLEELYRIRHLAPWLDTRLQEPAELTDHRQIYEAIAAGDAAESRLRMEQHSRESLEKKLAGLRELD